MLRISTWAVGCFLLALGITWFFSSLLDATVLALAGAASVGQINPISKMSLADNLSLLFAGLSTTGGLLVLLGVVGMTADGKRKKNESAAPHAN